MPATFKQSVARPATPTTEALPSGAAAQVVSSSPRVARRDQLSGL